MKANNNKNPTSILRLSHRPVTSSSILVALGAMLHRAADPLVQTTLLQMVFV